MSESTHASNRAHTSNGASTNGEVEFKELMSQLVEEGWTQSQIATELGVHRSTVNAWFTRDSVPAPYRASFIANAFGFEEERVRRAIKHSRKN